MHPKKNLSRGSLSNWCDADADADISKTISQPPWGGVHIKACFQLLQTLVNEMKPLENALNTPTQALMVNLKFT